MKDGDVVHFLFNVYALDVTLWGRVAGRDRAKWPNGAA